MSNRTKYKLAKFFLEDKEWLYNEYVLQNRSSNEISENLEIDPRSVTKFIKKHCIKKDKNLINKSRQNRIEETNLKKYGTKTTLAIDAVREKREYTMRKKYGSIHALKNKSIKNKQEETLLHNHGVRVPSKSEKIKNKIKKTNQKKYGGNAPICSSDIKKKIENTNLAKYGVKNPLGNQDIIEKRYTTNREKYGGKSPMCSEKIRKAAAKTNLEKYGVENPMQLKEIWNKAHETKKRNGTYNKSKEEDVIFELLKGIMSFVRRQCKTEYYPFDCDFYIPEKDLYIEYQGFTAHGEEPYDGVFVNPKWIKKAQIPKHKAYQNYIKTYTVSDPIKRKYAKDNKLNYLEIWSSDYKKGMDWIKSLILKQQLPLKYKDSVLQNEFENIKKTKGEYSKAPYQNKIIEHFHPHFYEKERQLWNNPVIREKLIKNREKYKFKKIDDITIKQMLQGFKISGIHTSFSFFSPLWIKAFIDEFNIKSVYDPCAGWGHRMLGSCHIEYHGNDLSEKTYEGLVGIKEYLKLKNTYLYNNPAEDFILNKNVDAVFTCPPYFDTEIYDGENTSTSKFRGYRDWLNVWWRKVVQNSLKSNPKYFSFIINNKYKEDMVKICLEEGLFLLKEIPISKNKKNHFQRTTKNSHKGEFLVVLQNI